MSPSTARIHSANMGGPSHPRTIPPTTSPPPTSQPDPTQGVVIDTPSFYALPLSFPVTPSLSSPSPALPTPLPPDPPPTPLAPSHSLVSSRGRRIKLHEHSIHLKPSSSLIPTPNATLPPPPSLPPPLPPPPPPSSPARVYHLHCWCLWQLRAEYLLGEVRRKLKKYSTLRATPSTPPVKPDPSLPPPPLALPLAGEGELQMTPQRRRWTEGEAGEAKEAEGVDEEAKWPALPYRSSPSSPSSSPLPLAPALSPSASLASVTGAIPSHHSLLTLPLISILSSTLSSLTVPPSTSTLPFFTALAQCLILPLPLALSSITPSHYDSPHSFNYTMKATVINGVWRPPPTRIAILYEEVEPVGLLMPPPEPPTSHKKGQGGVKVKASSHVKGKSHKKKVREGEEVVPPRLASLTPHSTRASRMAERSRKEEEREKRKAETRGQPLREEQAQVSKKVKTEVTPVVADEEKGSVGQSEIQSG